MEITKNAKVKQVDMKLEIVVIGVSDVNRAKAFLRSRLAARRRLRGGDFRLVQLTPHNSGASIIFGKGVTSANASLQADSLTLAVEDDVAAARDDLVARGVEVSEVFHCAGGPFNNAMENPAASAGPTLRVVLTISFASFEDKGRERLAAPEKCRTRFPSQEWEVDASTSPPWTSQPLRSSSARRRSTTATSRRRTPSTTGGTGTRLT